MARILYSGIVSELRGSVKGSTFQRNASGSIIKGKNNSRFSPSENQQYELTDLAAIAALWNYIPFGFKDEWQNFAVMYPRVDYWGRSKQISGYNWFMSINRNYSLISHAVQEQVPGDANVLPVPAYSIEASGSYIRMNFNAVLDLSDRYIILNTTGPRRASAGSSRQSMWYIKQVNDGAVQYIDFTSEWEAFFNMTWATFYAQNNAGMVLFPYAISLVNGVSSAYNIGYYSKF
jgi:hypothetical protein